MKSNEGLNGTESQRFAGQGIEALDPRARFEVLVQQGEDEKRQLRKAILDRYPPYKVEAMNVAVKQSREAIERFTKCIEKEYATISEYEGFIVQCEKRDKELEAAGLDPR